MISITSFVNYVPWSRIIFVGHRYLDSHVCSCLFAMTSEYLVLIDVMFNHPVAGLIIVNANNCCVWLFSCLNLYMPISSTQSISHGIVSASLAGK